MNIEENVGIHERSDYPHYEGLVRARKITSEKSPLNFVNLPLQRRETIWEFHEFSRFRNYENSKRVFIFSGLQPEPGVGKKSSHALSAANRLCHPLQILTGRETELHLNVMKELKSVTTEDLKPVIGCFYVRNNSLRSSPTSAKLGWNQLLDLALNSPVAFMFAQLRKSDTTTGKVKPNR